MQTAVEATCRPGKHGCRVPPHVLAEFDLGN
jgi:hypothetical protein